MALIDEVRATLYRLKSFGWGELFLRHGLDLDAQDLEAELSRSLSGIDRTIPGFEDFAAEGNQGITPGSPGRSLVYHALASSYVHPTSTGEPASSPEHYPSLVELDAVENYVFGLARKRLADFDDPVLAVFSYQYRVGSRSPHRVHADMAYSRTGVSRVGTDDANYEPSHRSFWVIPPSGEGIAVCPARYGVFLAERRMGSAADLAVLHGESDDRFRSFLLPVHKLFPGEECLLDEVLDASHFGVAETHVNEKLKKTHLANSPGVIPVLAGFRADEPPFVRESSELVEVVNAGASRLLVPVTPSDRRLVHLARQHNDQSGREEVVRFKVPKANSSNRFWTSFQITAGGSGRAAPEYVNMRQEVVDPTGSVDTLKDLNLLPKAEFDQLVADGGYDAAHFVDDSCDGALIADPQGLPASLSQLESFAAFSLVAAPDFLPLADQVDIQRWVDQKLTSLRDHFAQGGPDPLSNGRRSGSSQVQGTSISGRMPNPALVDPTDTQQPAFDRNDAVNTTITAVVGPASLSSPAPAPHRRNSSLSYLPDAASDVFAPGWDISQNADTTGAFYHSYGLGSPFPEDAKLCALLNSFWPAAAPDTSRTFGIQFAPTAIPMLDAELGHHPKHPRVLAGDVASSRGWDGEFGPFLEQVDGSQVVNYADKDRSDYVRHALDGTMSIAPTAAVDSDELIDRMTALQDCLRVLPQPSGTPDRVSNTRLWLVVAEAVADWAAAGGGLSGPGYVYEFVLSGNDVPGDPQDLPRLRKAIVNHLVCRISATEIRWNLDGGAFQIAAR